MVKVHKLVAAIATTFMLSTTSAYALNMGEISWKSAYGQPLNATIELSNIAGLTAKDIQASLASNAEFTKAGILHSNELAKLTFTTIMGKEGKAYIKVTSNSPIKEPYLDLLVNVSFQGTKISKDYTILLDLPSTNNKTNSKIASQPTNQNRKPPITTETVDKTSDSYKIQKGDTLWTIAEKERGTNNTAKTAAAIYKKNPNAFINGSINHLIAGYNIALPSTQEIQAIPLAEANALFTSPKETKQSNSNTTKQPVQTIVDKKQTNQLQNRLKSSEQALNTARLENDELSTKLEQLQNEIDKLKEVSDIKDEQINTIKSQLTNNQTSSETTATQTDSTSHTNPATTNESNANTETAASTSTDATTESNTNAETTASTSTATTTEASANTETAPSTTAATTTEASANTETAPSTTTATTTEANANAETSPSTTAATTTEANANTATTPSTPAIPNTDEDDSLFLGLDSSILIKLGCGVLLIVCIAALILRRKKAADETEVDLSQLLLDDSDSQEALVHQPDHSSDAVTSSSDSPKSTLEDGTNITDKVDIYLAYDRYEDAISLLSEALKTDPNNDEYRFKLLEIYAEQGDANNFEKAAQELLLHSPLAQQEVDKLRADHLALQEANINFAATKKHIEPTISSNFESATSPTAHADQFPVIEDTPIIAEPLKKSSDKPRATISQQPLTKDSTDTTPTTFSFQTSSDIEDAVSKANADFSLETIHAEPTIEKSPLFSTDGTDIDGFNTDSPVYEFADKKADLKKDKAEEENYKFDLGIDEHKASNNSQSEAKTLDDLDSSNDLFTHFSSTTDDIEDNSIDHADEVIEKDQITTKLELVHAYFEMNDTEGAHDLLNEIIQEGNEAQQAEAKQLLAGINDKANQEEINHPSQPQAFETISTEQAFEDLQPTNDKAVTSEATTILKESTETPKISEYNVTTNLNTDAKSADVNELDLGFELSTQDEVSTKLELAHAYIDMGDITGAKEILDEVLKEGNSEQQKQAEQLISSLH